MLLFRLGKELQRHEDLIQDLMKRNWELDKRTCDHKWEYFTRTTQRWIDQSHLEVVAIPYKKCDKCQEDIKVMDDEYKIGREKECIRKMEELAASMGILDKIEITMKKEKKQ